MCSRVFEGLVDESSHDCPLIFPTKPLDVLWEINGKIVKYLVAHPTARKWVITPVISGLTLLIPFITGVITHLRAVG